MLIIGTVQEKDDQVNIIVDRVVTKIESAQSADAALDQRGQAGSLPESNGGPLYRLDARSPKIRQPDATVESEPTRATDSSRVPPPPPNFDDDWQLETQPKSEELPRLTGDAPDPASWLEPAKPVTVEETYIARSGEEVKVPGNGNHRAHLIIVDIKPAGSWQDTCRRTVKVAKNFPGQDRLKLRFPGQTFTMDFPENQTDFCDDLVEALEKIPGIIRVYGE
jgi:hypothetical protein